MTLLELRARVRALPLIASVQADSGSPLDTPETLLRLAMASAQVGVAALRLQGVRTIETVRSALNLPVIGLVKRVYEDSQVYITPTRQEVADLLETGCEVIALDCTRRPRPGAVTLEELFAQIRAAGRLIMADCDSVEAAEYAVTLGADILSTTLAGYTGEVSSVPHPDLELVRQIASRWPATLLFAEGRYATPLQAQMAIRAGANAVVIGGALNDPIKQTRAFSSALSRVAEPVGAVDIGGTWMRFGTLTPEGKLEDIVKVQRPAILEERLAWIYQNATSRGLTKLGIGSGGTIDPRTRTVLEAKPIIPWHEGTVFAFEGIEVTAFNDGLATAWGHGLHPLYAGKRVATLALGTGVGCGLVDQGRLWHGPRGEYPRLNDVRMELGGTIEDYLGGEGLKLQTDALASAEYALELVNAFFMPDVVVLAGGIGLASWFTLPGTVPSPYGEDAGLMGAGLLAQVPPGS